MGNLTSRLTNWFNRSNTQVSPPAPAPDDSTTNFGNLPLEIRVVIWRLAFERDPVTIIAWPRAANLPMTQMWNLQWANYRNLGTNPPRSVTLPVTLQINHESRQETLRVFEPILAIDPAPLDMIARAFQQVRRLMPEFLIGAQAPTPRILTQIRYFIPERDIVLLEDGFNSETIQAARLNYLSQIPGSLDRIQILEIWDIDLEWMRVQNLAWAEFEPILRDFFRPFRGLRTLRVIACNWLTIFNANVMINHNMLYFGILHVLSELGMDVEFVWLEHAPRRIEVAFPPQRPGGYARANWDDDPADVYGFQ